MLARCRHKFLYEPPRVALSDDHTRPLEACGQQRRGFAHHTERLAVPERLTQKLVDLRKLGERRDSAMDSYT
jgi:hypothetical protein